MKTIAIFCAFLALSAANVIPDWFKVKTFFEARIIGGEEVVPHSYPYQAALFIDTPTGSIICGGSLISLKYVLTAAHCADKATEAYVVLGAHGIATAEPTYQTHTVPKSNIKYHEKWNSSISLNDIAVLELPQKAELNEYIQLVSLPNKSEAENSWSGKMSTFSGWGVYSNETGERSEVLRHIDTKVITNKDCNTIFEGIIQPKQICTAGIQGMSICFSDSGGPLVVDKKQVGIMSFVQANCRSGSPGVFTRVTEYLDWIAANTDVIIN